MERAALWAAYWALEALPRLTPAMKRAAAEIWLSLGADDERPPATAPGAVP